MPSEPRARFGQYPAPRHTVAHLSDPHLLRDGRLQYGVVDTQQRLRAALELLTRLEPAPAALVFTGDLADLAEPEAYRALRSIVDPAAESLGAEVIWVIGNHDERAEYARHLFGEDGAVDAPQDRVHELGGLRIISLDSTVPGYHHGALTDAQLAWLADVLATPAEHGTLLAMHHPPVPTALVPAAELIELHDQHRLAEVLEGSDVRAILAGHLHYSTFATFAGIPVSVASATCYTGSLTSESFFAGLDGHQAISMVHVYDDRVVHTVVPVHEAPVLARIPIEAEGLLAALSPEQQREAASAKNSPHNTVDY